MGSSVKSNYIYNLINTISGLLFPLITFPYASRILEADGIGHVNFYQSIIQYITMLSCLGIPMYSVKQIAKIRDDKELRDKTVIEIFILHSIITIIGYTAVFFIAYLVPEVNEDIPTFLILSLTIVFTTIGCEWFFQGIEDFKYITIRGLFVKIISVALLFMFVKSKEDIYWYAGYCVIGVLGGNIFNFYKLKKHISFNRISFNELNPFTHFLPALHIFALSFIISIYVQLNSVMLGFLSGNTSVGLFTAASKLSHMLCMVCGALGTVMLPRMSNLINNGKIDEFISKSKTSMQFVIGLSFPLTIGLFAFSPLLIPIFSGESYSDAIITLEILSPIIILISMSNVTGIQILYPMGKTNIVILSTGIGALVNFLLNLYLIPQYHQDGAAMSTVIAEACVTFSMLIIGRKHFHFNFFSISYLKYIVASLTMSLSIYLSLQMTLSPIILILLSFIIAVIVYCFVLYLLKDNILLDICNRYIFKPHKNN